MSDFGPRNRLARFAASVGTLALVGGMLSAGAGVAAAAPPPVGAFGVVSSVNGATAPGSCGTAGSAGTLTLATHQGTRNVAVSATTKFIVARVTTPSFANVCVGETASAVGTLSGTTINARQVVVPPAPPAVALGIVASVNGSSTAGTCGTAGSAGAFTLTTRTASRNVAVATTTRFSGGNNASFAGVCVNGVVVAVGPAANGTINASQITIVSRNVPGAPVAAFGSVSSVNGATAPGSCGTAGSAGTLTLATRQGTRNVAVSTTTKFIVARMTSPSFANVCVGETAGVVGTLSGTTINARLVVVPPAPPAVALGIVASVNGSSTAGTCGTAGASGTLTLTTRTGSQAVAVTPATRFITRAGITPSFAGVCVNGVVAAVGPAANGTITATQVVVTSRGA